MAALYENGRQSTDDLCQLIGADDRGLGFDVVEAALEGLVDADKLRAESSPEDRLWTLSGQGRLYFEQIRVRA